MAGQESIRTEYNLASSDVEVAAIALEKGNLLGLASVLVMRKGLKLPANSNEKQDGVEESSKK